MSKFVEFHLSNPGKGGFTMPGVSIGLDGTEYKTPEGEQLVKHMGTTISRPIPFTWPYGRDFLKFDITTEKGKAWVKFLENGSRCRDKVGPIKTVTYYKRDVEKEIMDAAAKTDRMARLTIELPALIGQRLDADKNGDKIRAAALAIGINGHDTKTPLELWTQCMMEINNRPNAVEAAIGNAGDNLFNARVDAWKKAGMIQVKNGNWILFVDPSAVEEDKGVDLGKASSVYQKLKSRKGKEMQDLYDQLLQTSKAWDINV